MAGTRKAYIVQRLHWEYNDNWYDVRGDDVVRAFEVWEGAELLRMELEDEARRTEIGAHSPASFAGGTARASSLTDDELRERLEAWRLPLPPEGDAFHDGDWWRSVIALVSDRAAPAFWQRFDAAAMTDEERERAIRVGPDDVWDLFDKVRFYEVVEVEVGVGAP